MIAILLIALSFFIVMYIEERKDRKRLRTHLDYVTKKAVEYLAELGELKAELEQAKGGK